MKVSFTNKQVSAVGRLPFPQREGELEVAENAARFINIQGINNKTAVEELGKLRNILLRSILLGKDDTQHADTLQWQFTKGFCLGVEGHRIHTALVSYALQEKLGHIYRVDIKGIADFMQIIHCWRYHGVEMPGVDNGLSGYAASDEVPYIKFKNIIDTMWRAEPDRERIIFQDGEGQPTSVFKTPIERVVGVRNNVYASINLSAYETMCCHVVSSMIAIPRSISLLGVAEESCYILDTTGRNEVDIKQIFSTLVFPKRYFGRLIRFDGTVERIEDNLI